LSKPPSQNPVLRETGFLSAGNSNKEGEFGQGGLVLAETRFLEEAGLLMQRPQTSQIEVVGRGRGVAHHGKLALSISPASITSP
jgi:hypothetical protein